MHPILVLILESLRIITLGYYMGNSNCRIMCRPLRIQNMNVVELNYVQIFGIIESTNLRISQTSIIIISYYVHTSPNLTTRIFDKVYINI